MTKIITYEELRKIKDSLPDGAVRQLASEFDLEVETVRNYFGGANYAKGRSIGIHIESGGTKGGIVEIDDDRLLERAQELIAN